MYLYVYILYIICMSVFTSTSIAEQLLSILCTLYVYVYVRIYVCMHVHIGKHTRADVKIPATNNLRTYTHKYMYIYIFG